MVAVAINGFGRIGRNLIRAIYENDLQDVFRVVAINDLGQLEANAHLLQFDTTHGRFNQPVSVEEDALVVAGHRVQSFQQKDPSALPWQELGIDLVMECTGRFKSRQLASRHLQAGASKVLVSAPSQDLDCMVVYGVNETSIDPEHRLISNASCTTNCLAHVANALNARFGIKSGLANTIHAYTSTQRLLDSYHKDMRRARAANYSMIPTTTGAAKAIGSVIPELSGKLDAVSVRVPTINVSLLDFTFTAKDPVKADSVNDCLMEYAENSNGIVECNTLPLVSIDFNHNSASCVFDIEYTQVSADLVKVLAWYDNEWAYCNRMLDVARIMMQRT